MEENVETDIHDEFRDDTSEIINLRDVEFPDVLEEDYSVHEYLEKGDIESKVEEALSVIIFDEAPDINVD